MKKLGNKKGIVLDAGELYWSSVEHSGKYSFSILPNNGHIIYSGKAHKDYVVRPFASLS